MALTDQSPYFYDPNSPTKRRPINGLVQSMTGAPAFNPGVSSSFDPTQGVTASGGSSNPLSFLPSNYNFNDLAGYEEAARKAYGTTASTDILNTRDKLAQSLNDQGKQFFQQQNPALLEDLNSRGLLTSPSEVANKETQALKEIELGNQAYLRDFDTSALSARLQAQQDALDAGSNLRSSGLEAGIQETQAQREERLAKELADKSSRNNLNNALIGGGASILGGALPSLLSKGVGATTTGLPSVIGASSGLGTFSGVGVTGVGAPASSLFPGGIGAVGTGATGVAPATGIGLGGALGATAGVGAGLASYELTRKALDKAGIDGTTGKALSAVPGVGLSVLGGQKVVNAVGGGAGHTENGNAIAATAGSLQQQRGDLTNLKQALDSGQIDQAAYDQQMKPIIQQYHQMVQSALSQGSVWASSIKPEWDALVNSGIVKAQNGQWVTNTGQVFWDPQKGWNV